MDGITAVNSVTSRVVYRSAASLAASRLSPSATIRPTNFYPRYNEANDQVDPVSRVVPAAFQEIIPRYRTSTSETRDLGTGPLYEGQLINILA